MRKSRRDGPPIDRKKLIESLDVNGPAMKDLTVRLESSDGPLKIDAITPDQLRIKELTKELEEIRTKYYEAIEDDDRGVDVSKVACPFCGERPTKITDNLYSEYLADPGWGIVCDNPRCTAIGPIRRTRGAALKSWERRKKPTGR